MAWQDITGASADLHYKFVDIMWSIDQSYRYLTTAAIKSWLGDDDYKAYYRTYQPTGAAVGQNNELVLLGHVRRSIMLPQIMIVGWRVFDPIATTTDHIKQAANMIIAKATEWGTGIDKRVARMVVPKACESSIMNQLFHRLHCTLREAQTVKLIREVDLGNCSLWVVTKDI